MNHEREQAKQFIDSYRGPAALQRVLSWAHYLPDGVDEDSLREATKAKYEPLAPVLLQGVQDMPRIRAVPPQTLGARG